MGCCLSTEENRATQKQSPLFHKPHQQFPCVSKSPPRSEEESVKEVLSETPKPRPRPEPEPIHGIEISKHDDPKTEELEEPTKLKLILSPKKPPLMEKQIPVIGLKSPDPAGHGRACTTPEEISDVSEMCSQSESVSTTTVREREENEQHFIRDSGEVLQRVYRSQGQNGHFTGKSRAFSGGRSPVRRSDPSPTRRRNVVSGAGQGGAMLADGQRKENPGRRSRSPATRSTVGRSPSARRTGPSPGRVRNGPGLERESGVRKVEEETGGRRENEDENEWQGPNESLENPLVSLECFIFL